MLSNQYFLSLSSLSPLSFSSSFSVSLSPSPSPAPAPCPPLSVFVQAMQREIKCPHISFFICGFALFILIAGKEREREVSTAGEEMQRVLGATSRTDRQA